MDQAGWTILTLILAMLLLLLLTLTIIYVSRYRALEQRATSTQGAFFFAAYNKALYGDKGSMLMKVRTNQLPTAVSDDSDIVYEASTITFTSRLLPYDMTEAIAVEVNQLQTDKNQVYTSMSQSIGRLIGTLKDVNRGRTIGAAVNFEVKSSGEDDSVPISDPGSPTSIGLFLTGGENGGVVWSRFDTIANWWRICTHTDTACVEKFVEGQYDQYRQQIFNDLITICGRATSLANITHPDQLTPQERIDLINGSWLTNTDKDNGRAVRPKVYTDSSLPFIEVGEGCGEDCLYYTSQDLFVMFCLMGRTNEMSVAQGKYPSQNEYENITQCVEYDPQKFKWFTNPYKTFKWSGEENGPKSFYVDATFFCDSNWFKKAKRAVEKTAEKAYSAVNNVVTAVNDELGYLIQIVASPMCEACVTTVRKAMGDAIQSEIGEAVDTNTNIDELIASGIEDLVCNVADTAAAQIAVAPTEPETGGVSEFLVPVLQKAFKPICKKFLASTVQDLIKTFLDQNIPGQQTSINALENMISEEVCGLGTSLCKTD